MSALVPHNKKPAGFRCDAQSCRVSGQLSESFLWCCQFYSLSNTGPRYLLHLLGSRETAEHFGDMVLLTMIARLADGLPLAASMQEDEQVKTNLWSLCGR